MRALLALLLAVPAAAQTRVVEVRLPAAAPAAPALSPTLAGAPALAPSLYAPALGASLAPSLIPAPAPAATRPAAAAPARLAALSAGVARAAASIGDKTAGSASLAAAGRDLEALLAGSLPAASVPDAPDPAVTFALDASRELAARADDLGAAKGLKASSMSGGDFIGLLEAAAAAAPDGPTPSASAAAREVRGALVRAARALIPADAPLKPSLPRALAVWQVFDQEMRLAADRGGLDAVVLDARLFASQVEDSAAAPSALAPNEHPEDPEGYAQTSVPGSVFGWKPIAESPDHGLPPLDRVIRRLLAERKSPHEKGFVLRGSARREDAKVFLYGERHSDGGLIAENMRLVVENSRPGKRVIVLVEGYTGWSMGGYEAVKYLAARGLDPEALAAKGVASGDVEVRGWDTALNYDASKHPLLQHHMDLLELNRLAHSEERGVRYYAKMARAGWTALKGWLELWKIAIVARNRDLDEAVRRAAEEADHGASVHVIAGSDHLLESPRLAALRLGRPRLRAGLRDALAGRAWRAGQPAHTIP